MNKLHFPASHFSTSLKLLHGLNAKASAGMENAETNLERNAKRNPETPRRTPRNAKTNAKTNAKNQRCSHHLYMNLVKLLNVQFSCSTCKVSLLGVLSTRWYLAVFSRVSCLIVEQCALFRVLGQNMRMFRKPKRFTEIRTWIKILILNADFTGEVFTLITELLTVLSVLGPGSRLKSTLSLSLHSPTEDCSKGFR